MQNENMVNTRLFEGKEYPLVIYNGQAAINRAIRFYTTVSCPDIEEIDFDFPDFVSAYFRVYNDRSERRIKNLVMTQYGPYLLLNGSVQDMTFEDEGDYYYEIGYNRGGYETALRYGKLHVI